MKNKLWTEEEEEKIKKEVKEEILVHLQSCEKEAIVDHRELLNDVFDKKTYQLEEQNVEFLEHVEKYKEFYFKSNH
jgi:TPP-dependent pyruvate/acetoin dehydrogenase alpha subunit